MTDTTNIPTAYTNLKKLEEKHGEIEFKAEIPTEILEKGMSKALARSTRDFELPGFRKGKVPAHMVREHVDEMELLEIAADEGLRAAVREIIDNEKLSIVGSPRLTITKIALKNPVEFKVRFALFPEITLPDYKKVAAEVAAKAPESEEVTEADMNESITRLLAMAALQNPAIDSDPDKKPELTNEIVKQFGPFESVADFKIKLKENLKQEKALGAKEARREEVMQAIVRAAKVEIPELLMDEEWYAFEEQRNEQLQKSGITLEDYLKQTKKSEKDLEKEERTLIAERIKTSMVFREIQKKENIAADEKEVQTNIAYLKLRYPDNSESWLRQTAEAVIVQEKIFDMLGVPLR